MTHFAFMCAWSTELPNAWALRYALAKLRQKSINLANRIVDSLPVTASRLLDRTLLYTALTRATRRVVLVGDLSVIRHSICRPRRASRRATFLAVAISDAIGIEPEAKAA